MTRLLPVPARRAVLDALPVVANVLLRLPGQAFRIWVLRRLCSWSVGAGTIVARGAVVTARGGVTIGEGCVVNYGVTLDGIGGLVVGDHVNFSPEVLVLTGDHDPDSPTFRWRARPVSIGSRAWISTRAMVLPGSTVGEGAVVCAAAVVSGHVAPFTLVAGVPARPIRERAREAQQSLPLRRRWWR